MIKFTFIAVPPEQPVIYDTNGIVTMKHVGPYNEGSDLILTCEVSGGKFSFVNYYFHLSYYYYKSVPIHSFFRTL